LKAKYFIDVLKITTYLHLFSFFLRGLSTFIFLLSTNVFCENVSRECSW